MKAQLEDLEYVRDESPSEKAVGEILDEYAAQDMTVEELERRIGEKLAELQYKYRREGMIMGQLETLRSLVMMMGASGGTLDLTGSQAAFLKSALDITINALTRGAVTMKFPSYDLPIVIFQSHYLVDEDTGKHVFDAETAPPQDEEEEADDELLNRQ